MGSGVGSRMKTVYICPNTGKTAAMEQARAAIEHLCRRGIALYGPAEAVRALDGPSVGALTDAGDRRCFDLAIVLGGDGTILRAAHTLAGSGTPILGVNLGRMGYLAETEPSDLPAVLDRILCGSCRVEDRAVLQGTLRSSDGSEQILHAFNDFTLHRGAYGGMLPVRVSIGGTYMDTFSADGVIASTPTGSTAYNFSAGGPLVNPMAKNIIFTPVCAHSVFSRSIVLMADDRLTFEADASDFPAKPTLSVDGDAAIPIVGQMRLDVELAGITFPLIRTGENSFYEILKEKMFR